MNLFSKIKDSHLKDLIKGGSTNFIFYALNVVVVYFLSIFISKIYGAEVYGRFAIIKSLVIILIIFSTLGLNTLAIKYASNGAHYSKGFYKSNFLKKSYFIIFFSTLFIAGLFFFNNHFISLTIFNDGLLEDYFMFFPILLFSAVSLNYNSNLFKGQGRITLFSILSSFLSNIILLLLIYFIHTFISESEIYIVLCLAFSFLLVSVISFFYVLPIKWDSQVHKIKTKNLIKSSLPMMISAAMIYLIFSVDTIMLGILDTTENVGIYRIVAQISSVISIFIIVLGAVVGPKISFFFSNDKMTELKRFIQNTSKLVFFISLPIFLLIIIFASPILNFFGENFQKGYSALLFLSVCQFLFVITGFVDLILNMTGHQKIFGKITIISAMLNVVLNAILIPKYGINGAAMATGFTIVLNNFIGLIYIKKKLEILTVYLPLRKR